MSSKFSSNFPVFKHLFACYCPCNLLGMCIHIASINYNVIPVRQIMHNSNINVKQIPPTYKYVHLTKQDIRKQSIMMNI